MRLRRPRPRTRRGAALLAALALAAGCSSWRVEREGDGWELLRQRGVELDGDAWAASLSVAHGAVAERLGPFDSAVRAHAWTDAEGTPLELRPDVASDGALDPAPGLGPARVSAFHVRPDGDTGGRHPAEVYLASADVSAAVHELVHVRLAELDPQLPLWFEEGLASLYADGVVVDGRWHVDGLACWPWTELRRVELSDDELARLLALRAEDDYGARDNRLVHFVGWALVFDLANRRPQRPWRDWLAAFERAPDPVAEARVRLARSLDPETVRTWLGRLEHDDPAVRLATAKGTWKLGSATLIDRLLDALEDERDPTVRAALALNAVLAAGETEPGWFRWQRLRDEALPALRHNALPDPVEQDALRTWAEGLTDAALPTDPDGLLPFARLWRE